MLLARNQNTHVAHRWHILLLRHCGSWHPRADACREETKHAAMFITDWLRVMNCGNCDFTPTALHRYFLHQSIFPGYGQADCRERSLFRIIRRLSRVFGIPEENRFIRGFRRPIRSQPGAKIIRRNPSQTERRTTLIVVYWCVVVFEEHLILGGYVIPSKP